MRIKSRRRKRSSVWRKRRRNRKRRIKREMRCTRDFKSLAWKSPCITPECWRTANSGSTTCPSDVEISSASSKRSAAPRANG
ncbi:hypothetical protein cypCar_00047128 [Cyprinus carpio]|nr:hypothetical protein cypCar_00047128 [Cyprinus carpio]